MLFNQVNAATGAITVPNPRGCNNVEPWQTALRGLASYTIPKIDVLVSAVLRSQPSLLATRRLGELAGAELGDRGGARPSAAGSDGDRQRRPFRSADNEHRVYADDRRTQVDMRFAKIVRFGRTRTDIGVDLNNLFNTNYATRLQPRPTSTPRTTRRGASGWGTPTSIVNPRFVRCNFTVNF